MSLWLNTIDGLGAEFLEFKDLDRDYDYDYPAPQGFTPWGLLESIRYRFVEGDYTVYDLIKKKINDYIISDNISSPSKLDIKEDFVLVVVLVVFAALRFVIFY